MSPNTLFGGKISETAENDLVVNSSVEVSADGGFFIKSFQDDMKDAPFDDLTPSIGKGSEERAGALVGSSLEADGSGTTLMQISHRSSHLQPWMNQNNRKKAKGLLRTWKTQRQQGSGVRKRLPNSKPRSKAKRSDIFGERNRREGRIKKKENLVFSLAPITMGEVLLLGLKEEKQLRSRKVRNVLRVGEMRVEMFRCEVESPLRGVWGWVEEVEVEEEGEENEDGVVDEEGFGESGVK